MPALRDRKEDIPLLVRAFLQEASKENGKDLREMDPEAMGALLTHNWPGNVRELRAAVEHAVVMCAGTKIGFRDLPPAVRGTSSIPHGLTPGPQTVQPVKDLNLQASGRVLMLAALSESGGNRTAAAKRLGISRRTLHRRLKELNISKQLS